MRSDLSPQVLNYGSYLSHSLNLQPYNHHPTTTTNDERYRDSVGCSRHCAAAAEIIPSAPLTQISPPPVVHPHRPAWCSSPLAQASLIGSKPSQNSFRQSHPSNPYSCTSCSSYACNSLKWYTLYRLCMLPIKLLQPRVPSLSSSSPSTADGRNWGEVGLSSVRLVVWEESGLPIDLMHVSRRSSGEKCSRRQDRQTDRHDTDRGIHYPVRCTWEVHFSGVVCSLELHLRGSVPSRLVDEN